MIEKALPAIKFGIKATLKAGVSWVLKQDATDLVDDFELKGSVTTENHSQMSLILPNFSPWLIDPGQ